MNQDNDEIMIEAYYLNDPVSDSPKLMKKYNEKLSKLYDRYSDQGKDIYDIAIQRHIIENDVSTKDYNIKYYLAVLNHNYVYDGYMEDGKRVYNTIDGEDIVNIFDFTNITKEMQARVNFDKEEQS